ncbi:MAG: nitroreductase family deazaflavin-dependent oxidoreductase [Gammaproteobacteria bacterium]|nr:nitroreductase family deazaflavin-dependent oxidoreductase [Gammaproteobacteria bacterium]
MSVNTQPWFIEHMALWARDPVSAHDWDTTPVGGAGICPTLLLTTRGRHSGDEKSLPLLYQPSGEGFVIVASRGGSAHHPGWYHNLQGDPACKARVGCMHYHLLARTLEGDERARWWHAMSRFWPAYTDYQARTTRQIPVVMLRITSAELIR